MIKSWIKQGIKDAIAWMLSRDFVQQQLGEIAFRNFPTKSEIIPEFALRSQPRQPGAAEVTGPIFISSRFRSGSTLLWRCFRELEDVNAYYEPLNPRKWFDKSTRGSRVDTTHRNVDDYWREYDSLGDAVVPWSDRWTHSDLYMPTTAPGLELRNYIDLLINNAPGKCVLQFNRVDFRLHWLRTRFPSATVIHLYRNPRDQWLSTFLKHPPVSKTAVVRDFLACDEFYLLEWVRDLRRWFPLFSEVENLHPYELSYLVWSMSQEFGNRFSDLSVSYEALVSTPRETLQQVEEVTQCAGLTQTSVIPGIDSKSVGRWPTYAKDDWFRDKEKPMDELLRDCVFGPVELSN